MFAKVCALNLVTVNTVRTQIYHAHHACLCKSMRNRHLFFVRNILQNAERRRPYAKLQTLAVSFTNVCLRFASIFWEGKRYIVTVLSNKLRLTASRPHEASMRETNRKQTVQWEFGVLQITPFVS